jgi:DNA recombination protein RmuC
VLFVVLAGFFTVSYLCPTYNAAALIVGHHRLAALTQDIRISFMTTELFITAVFALFVGGAIGWLLARNRGHQREQRLHSELAVAQSQLKSQQQLEQERQTALQLAMERLASNFDSVAGETLRSNSEVFLKLAREHLGQHHQAASATLLEREKAIETLVAPIREALIKTELQISRIEKERAEAFGSLRMSLETVTLGQQALQKETRNLVTALRRPEVRGQWGELTLKRLVELAGMVEHCDFSEQVHTNTEGGALRPDMIVHMPDGRSLVVDVKTPLDAYLEAVEADTDEARKLALQRHAQVVAERVRQLSAKSYWAQFDKSPDFVILFIPGDQFLSAALAENSSLLEDAIRQDVIIATPTSFVALLKAVAYGWRQTALAENAQTIRDLGADLYKRLNVLNTHLAKLSRNLNGSVEAFNSAMGSLERQVLPGARKFTELGIRPDKELDTIDPIEALARTPQALPGDSE